ncbi:hypothetical protein BG011_008420 [Mortierella polycephala]|uniref:Uncharacterized protein n=1 Tax=Mortierella polycephala TaxID=41804 RepID=A0A9P6PMZ6_9FUNG|nr:hypothetical protein BG011_008420 [Mortierella polycephala]
MPPKREAPAQATEAPQKRVKTTKARNMTIYRFTQGQQAILIEFMQDPFNFQLIHDHGKTKGIRNQAAYAKMAEYLVDQLTAKPHLIKKLDLSKVDAAMVESRWRKLVSNYQNEKYRRSLTGSGARKDNRTLQQKYAVASPFFNEMQALFTGSSKHDPVVIRDIGALCGLAPSTNSSNTFPQTPDNGLDLAEDEEHRALQSTGIDDATNYSDHDETHDSHLDDASCPPEQEAGGPRTNPLWFPTPEAFATPVSPILRRMPFITPGPSSGPNRLPRRSSPTQVQDDIDMLSDFSEVSSTYTSVGQAMEQFTSRSDGWKDSRNKTREAELELKRRSLDLREQEMNIQRELREQEMEIRKEELQANKELRLQEINAQRETTQLLLQTLIQMVQLKGGSKP